MFIMRSRRCLIFVCCIFGLSLCESSFLESLENPDVREIITRLTDEMTKRLLLQSEVDILSEKVERLYKNEKDTDTGQHSTVAKYCQDGWIRFGKSCYLFNDEVNVSLDAATQLCASYEDSHIVTIESREEEMFLMYQANKLFKGVSRASVSFWFGATCTYTDGHWRWYTNNDLVSQGYNNWVKGQGPKGSVQGCALFWGDDDFKWHDHFCSHKGHVLCENNS